MKKAPCILKFKAWALCLIALLVIAGGSGQVWFKQARKDIKNIILIGWDGAQREHLLEMFNSGQLPNLSNLAGNHTRVAFIDITTGKTQTKPGWAEILTGYSAFTLNITHNKYYHPIPKGYTIFERLESYFGRRNIVTVFIGGKSNNIGARGKHEICINVPSRDPVTHRKTFYWDKRICVFPTENGKPHKWVFCEGEPYFYTKDRIDLYKVGLGDAKTVAQECLLALHRYQSKPFFMFFQFEEPDEQGHLYGENSDNYSNAIKEVDYWLGIIIIKLKELNLYDKTTIFVVSDHGIDEGGFEHYNAPYTFFATNSKRPIRNGDRKDITPTILEEYGIDILKIKPPLEGNSLFIKTSNN